MSVQLDEGDSPDRRASRPPAAAQVPAVSVPEVRKLLGLVAAAIVVAALYVAQDVLIPITLAVILSFVLSPLVNLLDRLHLSRAPAVLVSVLIALGGIGLIGTLLGSQAAALAADAPRYAETIEQKVLAAQGYAAAQMAVLTNLFPGVQRPAPQPAAPPAAPPTTARAAGGQVRAIPIPAPGQPVLVEIAREGSSPFGVVRTILTPVLGPLETTLIVLVVAIFILLQKEDLRDRFIRLVGASDLNRTTLALDDAGQRLSRYLLSQLAVNATFGLVVGLGLWGIGLPSPAVWGILAGVLRFVPYLGSIMAAIAPIGLAAAMDPGWSLAAYVALLFVIVEPITGYVVEPLLYGHSTGLTPISVIVAAVFWTWIWGPIGLILSTPLTLCLVVVGRHVKSLEFFDVLLGDRPALPAVQRFYQRILANDPDEVLEQAEAMLADRTLLEYYDDVVLQGLKLAADDQAVGRIGPERAVEMTRSMLAVVTDLDKVSETRGAAGRRTVAQPSSAGPAVVACISGRGSFDDAVSAMLAQLLVRAGIPARRIASRAVSRDAISGLDLSNVAVIALSYLELTGSPAHLRYLIGRIRERAPDATIIVGLWPSGEAVLTDAGTQTAFGADRYVGSLRDAIDATRAALANPPAHSASA